MALDDRQKRLVDEGNKLFQQRAPLDAFWQESALAFYPEMASFTSNRGLGEDFSAHLMTSYPLLARRTLGDSFSALLRPTTLENAAPGVWFSIRTSDPEQDDVQARAWLERSTSIMRRAMYDRPAMFARATKEADHSFATFGQAVLSAQLNQAENRLLFQHWHLRDVVWTEDAYGQIDAVWRRWKPSIMQLCHVFGGAVDAKVKEKLEKDPFALVECRHVVVRSQRYEIQGRKGKRSMPWTSLYLDIDNQTVMSEAPSHSPIYVIPRWVTIPGSQYACSPAVTAALPDARLMQAMTATMLEAGEKFADPPLIATMDALRSDVNAFAGGITHVDAEYNEKLGEALRPLYRPEAGQGLNSSFQMSARIQELIGKAFFLDSLQLPPADLGKMTAFEVAQRMSEWIRRAMPIFEPLEFDYNGQLCEVVFDILMRNGGFGPLADMPPSLDGANVQFKFESPLHASADRQLGQKFLEAKAAMAQAAELDPTVVKMIDASKALRSVLTGIGVPADWTRDDDQIQQMAQAAAEQAQQQQMMGQLGAGSEMAKNLGQAAQAFAAAGGGPGPQGGGAPAPPAAAPQAA